jgi:hypothetical protein
VAEAYLESKERASVEIESESERQEVPQKEAAMETNGALKERYGDPYLVARCRGRLTRLSVTVVRDQTEEEPLKDEHSGRKVDHNRNATMALGTEAQSGSYVCGRRGQPATASEEEAGDRNCVRLGIVKILHEALGQTLLLEVVKRVVDISIKLRKMNDWTLWRGRPLAE